MFLLVTVLLAVAPPFVFLLLLVGSESAGMVGWLYLILVACIWAATVLEALTVHSLVVLGGGKDLSRTLSAHAIPSLIRYGLWWVPVLNVALGCYGWYLQLQRLSTLHGFSMRTGVVVGVIGLLLFGVVIVLAGAFFLALLVEGGLLAPV